jgi:hypothetical protein
MIGGCRLIATFPRKSARSLAGYTRYDRLLPLAKCRWEL